MPPLRVAIIGSIDLPPDSKKPLNNQENVESPVGATVSQVSKTIVGEDLIPKLKNKQNAIKAAQELGQALAKSGSTIVVYSDKEWFLERHVLEGYLDYFKQNPNKKGSVEVHFPKLVDENDVTPFNNYLDNTMFTFKGPIGDKWEISFYRSLADVDGALFLGGGRSSLIAGIVLMGSKKAILACPNFGGATETVHGLLGIQKSYLTDTQIQQMVHIKPDPDKLVELLMEQKKKIDKANSDEQRVARNKKRNWLALVAFVCLLVGVFGVWSIFRDQSLDYNSAFLLLMLPTIFLGVCGANLRPIWDLSRSNRQAEEMSIIQICIIGAVAGLLAFVQFAITQPAIVQQAVVEQAVNAVPEGTLIQITRINPFILFYAVFISILGGLFFDLAFEGYRRLQQGNDPKATNSADTGG
jgi:hypothetical protein